MVSGIDATYTAPIKVRVGHGAVVNKPANTPIPSNVGKTRSCGMRIGFSDTVGMRLIISSATPLIHTAFTYGERAIQSPHSKLMNIGTIKRPAPPGAGTPLKYQGDHAEAWA